jgi:hypothetical protein
MLTATEKRNVAALATDCDAIESVSMILQTDSPNGNINLALGRALFDDLIRNYPAMRHHLAADADIVDNKDFDYGTVKIQRGLESTLRPVEKRAISRFL